MTDLPDDLQREFEVRPDRKLMTIGIARRGHVYPIDSYVMDKVQNAPMPWKNKSRAKS